MPFHDRTIISDCPCCGYKKALSVTVRNGRELFYCHAGCSQADLLAVLQGHAPAMQRERLAPQKDAAGVQAFIEKLWRESQPARGTLVETYLASRGLK